MGGGSGFEGGRMGGRRCGVVLPHKTPFPIDVECGNDVASWLVGWVLVLIELCWFERMDRE